jgi:predicted metal-binding membrane protein
MGIRDRFTGIRGFGWDHPEWWCVAASVGAWLWLGAHVVTQSIGGGHHCVTFEQELGRWTLMVVAMMVPLTLDQVRATAFATFRGRRHGAIALFLLGFLVPWTMLGLLATWAHRLGAWTGTPFALVALLLIASLWPLAPLRATAAVACHRSAAFAADGWHAVVGGVGHGLAIGCACVVTCWPLMLACQLSGHAPLLMVGGAAIAAIEKLSFYQRRRVPVIGAAVLALGFPLLSIAF